MTLEAVRVPVPALMLALFVTIPPSNALWLATVRVLLISTALLNVAEFRKRDGIRTVKK